MLLLGAYSNPLEAYCPYFCDENGDCVDDSTCTDGKTIAHYYDLTPHCFSVPGLTYGSPEEIDIASTEVEEAIMREIWENGPVSATMAMHRPWCEHFTELEYHMLHSTSVYHEHRTCNERDSDSLRTSDSTLSGWHGEPPP